MINKEENIYEIKQRIAEYHRRSKPFFDELAKLHSYKSLSIKIGKDIEDTEFIYSPDTELETYLKEKINELQEKYLY